MSFVVFFFSRHAWEFTDVNKTCGENPASLKTRRGCRRGDVTLPWLLELLSGWTAAFQRHTHTNTHTAGMLGCWIWPSILADGLGATLSVTIVTRSLFFPLSLPVSSAKRRKMADKILPQRVRLQILCVPLLLWLFSVWRPGWSRRAQRGYRLNDKEVLEGFFRAVTEMTKLKRRHR